MKSIFSQGILVKCMCLQWKPCSLPPSIISPTRDVEEYWNMVEINLYFFLKRSKIIYGGEMIRIFGTKTC